VTRAEHVMDAFAPLGKTGKPASLPQCRKTLRPAGEQLVRVTLMADIPDDLVRRRIKNPMNRNGQLDHAKIGRKMPPVPRYRPDNHFPNLGSKNVKLRRIKTLQVGRTTDKRQNTAIYAYAGSF
jgi:hypothetical protein